MWEKPIECLQPDRRIALTLIAGWSSSTVEQECHSGLSGPYVRDLKGLPSLGAVQVR